MNRRLEILQFTATHRRLGGNTGDWLRNIFAPPCAALAARAIIERSQADGFHRVRLRGLGGVLFFPADLPLHYLYMTLAEQLYHWSWHRYEVPETQVGTEDIVFDCGSAEGLFAFLVRDRAREVHCFEPLPAYLAGLRRTFDGAANVHLVEAALSDRTGAGHFSEEGISSGLTQDTTAPRVAVTTIDAYVAEHGLQCGYIKADLEGHELAVLHGAAETIRRFRPRIAITTYHHPAHAEQIRDLLTSFRPDYRFRVRGVAPRFGCPVMLHAW
jgi:FkbM family methyltransferase